MASALTGAPLCESCSDPIEATELAHSVHESGCSVLPSDTDWSCRCDALTHAQCCLVCVPCM